MNVVNIVDVASKDLSEQRFWGFNLELPVPGRRTESPAIDIAGWVLGRRSPTLAVELIHDGVAIARVPVEIHREDVARAFSEIAGAERCGFRTTLDISAMGSEFEIHVRAIFEGDAQVEIGTICGRHDSSGGETWTEDVLEVSSDALEPRLWGCQIERPTPGSQSEIYAIDFEGWVLARRSPAVALELRNGEAVFRRIPIDVQRPDIAAWYPSVSDAERCGFQATVNVLGLDPEFELIVRAVLEDESHMPIGVIRGYRRTLRTNFRPRFQPLMISTLGRSGSTWLARLLGQHPKILAYRPFEYEPRVGGYWMQILKTVSEPASYLQTLNTNLSNEYWWLGQESHPSAIPADPEVHQYLGRDSIEEFAAFCQNRIEEFYERIADVQGRSDAVYFAEKYSSEGFFALIRTMTQELYPRSREILLVRDFRDMVCSILAYNAKQNVVIFGRDNLDSNEEFIERVQRHAHALLRRYESMSSKTYLLRYEDLILRSVGTLSTILEYLDLDSSPSIVEGMIERASEDTLSMQVHRTSPDPERSIGRWRHDMDPTLQAICQEAFGEVLAGFGYDV